jgi:hypothetical protein
LSLNQIGALAMTLPDLINKALRSRYGDDTLRYAYPLASWTVERSSDPRTGMITLSTTDVSAFVSRWNASYGKHLQRRLPRTNLTSHIKS